MFNPSNNRKKTKSTSSTAKQIRDVQRSLKLESLSASVRVELERKLKTLQQLSMESKARSGHTDVQKIHMEKYRMVRFFEKKKALKRLKSLIKSNAPSEEVDKAKLDLNYTVHFPKDTKYISLYPNNNSESPIVLEKKAKIMGSIKSDIASGLLCDIASELLLSGMISGHTDK
ncbi:rRNA-processing protein efg1 [Mitosporidium daphniae]|uniref:rRNA-processing protein EFG1 n=1 Tax=Mitosporidium daphniae TaxID=1485682 RepID=A0A098VTR1_9MICR|nr:rRNA-processing protein Efg1-related protein [Mitosporidium daphniae]KGG52488.1 rRNA-processing protein Efg1-related protein [Mitosporidium daphniae]|eukprot:XP_013238924.1 rRNA-processing protein Efg1-related protein [Mitosporidium daphniae]